MLGNFLLFGMNKNKMNTNLLKIEEKIKFLRISNIFEEWFVEIIEKMVFPNQG